MAHAPTTSTTSSPQRRSGPWRPEPRMLLRVAGIPVGADATLLVIAALVTWSFWARFQHTASVAAAVVMAVVATALFLASILGHELAHALEARRRGLRVDGITLYVFGGVTRIRGEVARAGDEFALTAVGPWTSISLGCAFGLVAYGAGRAGLAHVAEVAGELGWLNVVLGIFNLLPGAPLDGGRILDSVVWRLTGDRWRSARVASAAGRVLGGALVGLGVAEALLVTGGFVGGLWLVLIGWFLMGAAASERRAAAILAMLRDRTVWEVTAPAGSVPAGSVCQDALTASVASGRNDVVLVTRDTRVVGVVAVQALRDLSFHDRWELRVEELMTAVATLPSIEGNASASDLVALLEGRPVMVTDDGDARAVITEEQLANTVRWLGPLSAEEAARRRRARGGPGSTPRPGGRRRWRSAVLVASGAIVVAALGVVPLPLAAMAPGPALDVPSLLRTAGPVHPVDGHLVLTTVAVSAPSAVEAVRTLVDAERDLSWTTSVVPAGIDPADYDATQRQVFRDSVQLAAAVALRQAGYPVKFGDGGAIVQGVGAGMPADGKLQAGDVVTAVDGQPVASAADFVAQLADAPAGLPVRLDVRRDGRTQRVAVTPVLSGELGHSVIGVALEDAVPLVELPFSVQIDRADIGGPSAGLMTALSVYAVTTGTDLTHGATVAGTGTLDAEGKVGAIGGVAEKVAAAADAGATVFLVPAANAVDARRAAEGRPIRVVPVTSFSAALAALGSPVSS